MAKLTVTATHTRTDLRGGLTSLHEELLALVLALLPPRDVEAVTVASRTVAFHVLPAFPIWKENFVSRWNTLNYELERDATSGDVHLKLDRRLKEIFPSTCSESRIYQLLAHAVTPVPSYIDVRETMRARPHSSSEHFVETLSNPKRRRALDVAYAGRYLGGDRCVRSNVPFAPIFRIAVYADPANTADRPRSYTVGAVVSGYFEITISERRDTSAGPRRMVRTFGTDMTSIGIATALFPLVDRQPGWDGNSIGYHGDDGHLFKRHNHGEPFATPFGVGDTVGCGIRRDQETLRTYAYFTNNGDMIPTRDQEIECRHLAWFPVVGLDSLDAVHFNFGQEPFMCSHAVDVLFRECEGQAAVLVNQLQWYNFSDSDGETSDEEGDNESDQRDRSDNDDDDGEYDLGNDSEDESDLEMELLYEVLGDELSGTISNLDEVSDGTITTE